MGFTPKVSVGKDKNDKKHGELIFNWDLHVHGGKQASDKGFGNLSQSAGSYFKMALSCFVWHKPLVIISEKYVSQEHMFIKVVNTQLTQRHLTVIMFTHLGNSNREVDITSCSSRGILEEKTRKMEEKLTETAIFLN